MADNPYTGQSISGYNASPPPDDGSQSSGNQLEWAKHITKIGNPLKALAEAIDTAVSAAFGSLLLTDDPAEETVLLAAVEFSGPGSAVMLARRANRATSARNADQAADLSVFSENVVVGIEEFV